MNKRIAVVEDISGLGRCSLGAALPVLSVMGLHCLPMATAVYTNQTGYGSFDAQQMPTDFLQKFAAQWPKYEPRPEGILTGFFADTIHVRVFRKAVLPALRGPGTLLLVDPVMGDGGERYAVLDAAFEEEMRRLAAAADVITPNVTELCMLAGIEFQHFAVLDAERQLRLLREMCQSLGVPAVVVTGWRREAEIQNVVWQEGQLELLAGPAFAGSFSGTGDLFAAALCGGLMRGDSLSIASRRAACFLAAALHDADGQERYHPEGVPFERHLHLLWEEAV
jgi:pyridoxine kinase